MKWNESLQKLTELEARLRKAELDLALRQGKKETLQDLLIGAEATLAEEERLVLIYEQASAVLSSFADARQESVVLKVETLVSEGLKNIFGEGMQFLVRLDIKAKRTSCSFYIKSKVGDEYVETPVLSARGGGVAAVAGFLLRTIILLLTDSRRIIFLDETFAQLSAEYEEPCANFLRMLADKANVQIVLVTHSETYSAYADVVYRTSLKNGWTSFERLL